MVFVVLGTWEMPFLRPLLEIEKAVAGGVLREPVLVQSGNTAYSSSHMRLVPFFGQDEFGRMYDRAGLVICQAGVGSIMMGLKRNKKVVAIARRARLNEHIDDHQLEILHMFSRSCSVLPWRGDGDLPEVLGRAEAFVPASYPFGEEKISGAILDYLRANVNVP
jgi:UDP-N-acetylglucosamine transferase subunit ALG13